MNHLSHKTPKLIKPMTKQGFARLAAEHDQLFLHERPKILEGIQIAAAEGDRSENAEYIYGRKRLRELDKRIRYLGSLLKDVQLIDPTTIQNPTIGFGATVVLRDELGRQKTYMLVGDGEANAEDGSISWKSPLARAVMGKNKGDFIMVYAPKGEIEYEIVDFYYA